jgi:hypothetical protein
MDELRSYQELSVLHSNSAPYSFLKREDQLDLLGLQRPLPLRTTEATAIDVEQVFGTHRCWDRPTSASEAHIRTNPERPSRNPAKLRP